MGPSSTVVIPRLYFGTMTFGWSQTSSFVDEAIAAEMMDKFVSYSCEKTTETAEVRVDTARIYAGEKIVGKCLSQLQLKKKAQKEGNKFTILLGTKAHPSGHKDGLSKIGIQAQLDKSLDTMGRSVAGPVLREYYLHQPDTQHPLEESLEYLNELVDKGAVAVIGMSNYHASEMRRALDLCKGRGWAAPSVYQGLYNPLNRAVEDELLPLLRENDCSFVAYNPLAAGILAVRPDS